MLRKEETCLKFSYAGSSESLVTGIPTDACILRNKFLFPTRFVWALSIKSYKFHAVGNQVRKDHISPYFVFFKVAKKNIFFMY